MDLNQMMQQAQKMQEELVKAQEEAKSQIVEGSAGGGAVVVKATGAGRITEVTIDPKAIDPDDPEALGDLVLAAVNNALDAAESLMKSKLGGLMGGLEGLGLPGL
jgi:DNA-binding YbaB/EbfC family protein